MCLTQQQAKVLAQQAGLRCNAAMQLKRQTLDDFEARSVLLFATVLVGAALALPARGQTPPPARPADKAAAMKLSTAQIQQAFQQIDSNHDGSLSRAEVAVFPRIERHFERIDADRDGKLSPREFEDALQQSS